MYLCHHEASLWGRGAASHQHDWDGAKGWDKHSRGGTSYTPLIPFYQALIPFSKHQPLSRPHKPVIFPLSGPPFAGILATLGTAIRQDLHGCPFWGLKKGGKKK